MLFQTSSISYSPLTSSTQDDDEKWRFFSTLMFDVQNRICLFFFTLYFTISSIPMSFSRPCSHRILSSSCTSRISQTFQESKCFTIGAATSTGKASSGGMCLYSSSKSLSSSPSSL